MNDERAAPADPYHAIAELYDLEHDDFRDDIDLLLTFADIVGDPILELGCGSGRILAPLAAAGFTVVGLDASEAMLDRARKRVAGANLKGNVTLVRGDMTDATTVAGGPFGLVIFSLNALMHLPAPDVQLRALQNAHAALDPRGQLIIDIMNPTPEYIVSLAASPALEGSWHLQDGSTVDKWSFRKIDPVAQEISTTLWYDQVGVRGELTRFRSQFDLRYVHLNELRLMLEIAGFTDVREYGSYEMDPLEANSDRIFVTAEVTPAAG